MDDFSFVGVNATLRNKHAHAREAKENEFHSNYWPRSFLVVSIVWNQRPKGKCGDMVQLELADLGFSILEVVSHHLHHLHHPCHLQARDCVSAAWTGRTPSRRQRTPFSGNGIGRVRRMRQDYVQSARCHGIKQEGPVFRPSAAACEPLPLEPPPSKAEMPVTCNCNRCCPPWNPAAPSVPPPTCVMSTELAALRFLSGGPQASSSRMRR